MAYPPAARPTAAACAPSSAAAARCRSVSPDCWSRWCTSNRAGSAAKDCATESRGKRGWAGSGYRRAVPHRWRRWGTAWHRAPCRPASSRVRSHCSTKRCENSSDRSLRSMRGISSFRTCGIVQLALGRDVEQQLVRHAAPQEIGEPGSQRVLIEAAGLGAVVGRLGAEQEQRRNQRRRASAKKMAGSKACPCLRAALNRSRYGAMSLSSTGRRNARGRKCFQNCRAPPAPSETPGPGLAIRIFARDLNSLAAKSMAKLGDFHVLFGMQRREEQGLGGVVEALAARAVGGQRVADVQMDVQQIADGGRVFVAVQAADRGGAGGKSVGAGSRAQGAVHPAGTARAARKAGRERLSAASHRFSRGR